MGDQENAVEQEVAAPAIVPAESVQAAVAESAGPGGGLGILARSLAAGRRGTGVPIPPGIPGNAAMLALQRSAGNRAAAKMLQRQPPTVTKIEPAKAEGGTEFIIPWEISAEGPNAAAKAAKQDIQEKGIYVGDTDQDLSQRPINYLVLNANSVYVYNDKAELKEKFDLTAKTAWKAGVWLATANPKAPWYKVLYEEGGLYLDQTPTVPEGKRLGKLDTKTEKKGRLDVEISGLVANPEKLSSALDPRAWRILIAPRYTGGGKKGGKGAAKGSFTSILMGEGKGEGDPPNAPPYPSEIVGPDIHLAGGKASYRMQLQYGSNSINATTQAMSYVTYLWELWKLPDKSKESPEAALKAQDKSTATPDATKEVTGWDAAKRGWSDSYDEEKEKLGLLTHHKRDPGQSDQSWAWERANDFVALGLSPASWIIGVGGQLKDSFIDVLPKIDVERDIPFPRDVEGLYMVRCIAAPETQVAPRPDGSSEVIRRAPSVASMLVDVSNAREIAQEDLDKAEADLAQTETQLKLAQLAGAKDTSELTKSRDRQAIMVRGSTADVLTMALGQKNTELNQMMDPERMKTQGYDPIKKRRLEEEIETLKNQLQVSGKRYYDVLHSGKIPIEKLGKPVDVFRIPATFVSEPGGQSIPLMLDLLEYPDSKPGAFHFKLSDITSDNSEANPDGRGITRRAAVLSCLNQYSQKSGLGKGVMAARVTQDVLKEDPITDPDHPDGPKIKPGPMTVKLNMRDIGAAAAKERIQKAILLASIIATAALGPAGAAAARALMIIGGVGAGVAAMNLIQRWDANTLRADSGALQDIIAIVSAVAPGVTAIAKLRVIPFRNGYMFASYFGDIEAASAAMAGIKATSTTVNALEAANKVLGFSGVFFAGADTIAEIQKITRDEREGRISHNEAVKKRSTAMTNALTNVLLYVFGEELGKHAEENQKARGEKEVKPKEQREKEGKIDPKERQRIDEENAAKRRSEDANRRQAEKDAQEAKRKADEAQQRVQEEAQRRQEEQALREKALSEGGDPDAEVAKRRAERDAELRKPSEDQKAKNSQEKATKVFRDAVEGKGSITEAGLDLVRALGSWKGLLKQLLTSLTKAGKAKAEAELVAVRDAMVDRAWQKVMRDPKLTGMVERFNVGTKAFGSDIDITVKPTKEALAKAGNNVGELIKLCTEAANRLKAELRAEVGGRETDVAIDTNVYSYIGEDVLIPGSPEERAARADFDRIVGLAESLRGSREAYQKMLAETRRKMAGDPESIRRLDEMASHAEDFFKARAAEEKAARAKVRSENKGVSPEVETRMMRDRIVGEKKAKLAEAASKKPVDIDLVTRLQSEILWFEPDAYATRAAIEQAVAQAQSLKAAGLDITVEQDVAGAKKALEDAQASKDAKAIERAKRWFDQAIGDRDAIAHAEAELKAVSDQKVAPKDQEAHRKSVELHMRALDEANNRFRSRVTEGAVSEIQKGLDARDYTPGEKRALGAGAASANVGMMEAHIAASKDVGEKVKYACKYGGRVLLALVLGGLSAPKSFAGEALLGLFTKSRWTFNEGPAGVQMMREMLTRYAKSIGKEGEIVTGKDGAQGVSPEVQEAFVRDMMKWVHEAEAKLWAEGLTKETWGGGLAEELHAVIQEREEAAAMEESQNPDLADMMAKRDEGIRKGLEERLRTEMGGKAKTRGGEEYEPSQSTKAADMPLVYRDAMEELAKHKDENSTRVRDVLMPIVAEGIRSPRYYAEVLSEAAMLARSKGITINEALMEMARRTGLKVKVLEKIKGGYDGEPFFKLVVGVPEYFVDNDIDSRHGHMTHFLQDLAVDRALTAHGINERSPQVRARMGRLPGRVDGLATGDALWRGTYDNETSKDFGTPEHLKGMLGRYGLR